MKVIHSCLREHKSFTLCAPALDMKVRAGGCSQFTQTNSQRKLNKFLLKVNISLSSV